MAVAGALSRVYTAVLPRADLRSRFLCASAHCFRCTCRLHLRVTRCDAQSMCDATSFNAFFQQTSAASAAVWSCERTCDK